MAAPGLWTDWTPTVTQGVSVTATVSFARYTIIGNTVIALARLSITSAGTGGSTIVIGGQPTAISHADIPAEIGTILVSDASVGLYAGLISVVGANDWRGRVHGVTSTIGITPNFALASGDFIGFQVAYERA